MWNRIKDSKLLARVQFWLAYPLVFIFTLVCMATEWWHFTVSEWVYTSLDRRKERILDWMETKVEKVEQ